MPRFPKKKSDVISLAGQVVVGITANPLDFPDPPFNVTALNARLTDSGTLRADRIAKNAAAKAAIDDENDNHRLLRLEVKQILRLAEGTWPGNAGKLQEIGWDLPATKHHFVPGQPRNLNATVQGAGSVLLNWKAAKRIPGDGLADFYRIERRVRDITTNAITEEWGVWRESVIEKKKNVIDQPRQVEISYRVFAVNANGDSEPSNSEQVVL